MVRVWWGRVRRRRWIVWAVGKSVSSGKGKRPGTGSTHPLDYPCPYACNVPLYYLVPRRAEHQSASRVYRGEQGIAVFQAVLEVGDGFAKLFDEPVEFAFLGWRRRARLNQHPRSIHFEMDHTKARCDERWVGGCAYLCGFNGRFKLVGRNVRPDFHRHGEDSNLSLLAPSGIGTHILG
jgi:hypothetical protein